MNSALIDSATGDEPRGLIYQGQHFVYSPTASSLALWEFIRKLAFRGACLRFVLALLIALGLAASGEAQTFDDPGFAAETITTLPQFQVVGLRFAPDGSMFIWQKNGIVRIFHDGVLHPTPFIDLSSQVNTSDDRGMIGLALDPGFTENGYVYLGFVYEPPGGNTNDPGPRISRLIRVTANPVNPDVALPGSQVILIDGIPADGTSHTLDSLRFAPDGTLFVSNGDGETGPSANVLALGSQDLNSYRGKILRINSDGSAPAPPQVTNPFYDGTNSIRSRVWAYGLRNPYRFDFHPVLGDLYLGDVGWNTWEELDHILPGLNYGWPCFEGPLAQPEYQATFPGQCSQLPQSATVAPIYTYNHSVGSAAIGGCFYTGGVYPSQYLNNFFFSDYTGNFVRRLVLDAAGNVTQNVRFATNMGAAVGMETGPDGLLYFVDFVSGTVRRVVFNGPVAQATGTPKSGYSPLSVTFNGSGSTDGLGRPLTYQWDFGDGQFSTQANPVHNFVSSTVQTFNVRLTVTNTAAQSSSATVPVTVGSLPPVPLITAPTGGGGVQPGDVVNYQGSATDPDQGVLPGSALSWTILLHHNTHVHRSSGGTGTSGSFVAQEHGAGTYVYEIELTATDASGLTKATSVMVPILQDTTPPSVPGGLTASAVGANSITLAWTASTDNGAVFRYHVERCTGPSCASFAEIGTAPVTTFVDGGLTASTSYTYRVRAEDSNANLGGYSATASATTGSSQNLPGLVAAYSFDAGLGTVLADASGNGNNGTINGATWTTGHDGQALSFNGSSNVVVVNDSASLDLTTGMTLEAWVRPSAAMSGWKSILQKESDAYFLNANTDANRIGVGGVFAGVCCTVLQSPSALAANQWAHVAGTYDGTTLRLYLNGTQVSSQAKTGALQVTGLPLRIGGNTYATEFFPGLIDNLRIYNRALSAAEVQLDMITAVNGSAPPDTTAPVRSSGTPSGVLPVGTTQTTLGLGTDEAATCRYSTVAGTNYAAMTGVFTTTGGLTHSTLVGGLANGQSYTFYVRCQDVAGNANTSDFPISFSVASAVDTTAPVRSGGTPSGVLPVGTTQATLGVGTNEAATCRYSTVAGTSYATMTGVFTTTGGLAHSTLVGGLANGQSYAFYVRCQDVAGNANTNDFPINFSVAVDTTAPVRSGGTPSGVLPVGTTQATLGLGTDEAATCRYSTVAGTTYAAMTGVFTTTGGLTHSTLVGGLANGQSYTFYVRCQDVAGNANTSDFAINFSVSNVVIPPTGLVAAYSFNLGSGTLLTDVSGNGNNGTINGATWTTGHDGQALSFNGTSNVVVVNDSASLDLTNGMTLEAWVRPTSALSSWKAILQKEVDAYFLNANTNANRIGIGGTFAGVCCTVLQSPSALAVNQWTHVAGTYDGTTLRLYVNGTQVSSQAKTGALQVTGLPLRIGGNTYGTEFFPGLIDNLRIYNRALSAAEVQQDMVTPVTP